MNFTAFMRCFVVALLALFWAFIFGANLQIASAVVGVTFSAWCLYGAVREALPHYRAWRRWRREVKLIGDPNEVYCSCGYHFGSNLPHVQHNAPKEAYEAERTLY